MFPNTYINKSIFSDKVQFGFSGATASPSHLRILPLLCAIEESPSLKMYGHKLWQSPAIGRAGEQSLVHWIRRARRQAMCVSTHKTRIDFVGDDTKDHLVNPSRCTLVKRFQLLLPHVVSSTAQCCLQPDLLRLRPSRPSGLPQCLLHKLASMLLFKMSSHIKAPT